MRGMLQQFEFHTETNGGPFKQKNIVIPWCHFGSRMEDWLESVNLKLDKS